MRARPSGTEPVAALRIDPDDLTFDLLPRIERSFAVLLPQDLTHVRTVGDLHAVIDAARDANTGPSAARGCATQMAFYRLRTLFRRMGLGAPRPGTRLREARLGSPRAFRAAFNRETGLDLPPLHGGCLASSGWMAALLLLPIALAIESWSLALTGIGVAVLGPRLDPGRWAGAYADPASLARAIAGLNHARFAASGARDDDRTRWNALVWQVAALGVPRDRIGRETRLAT